MATTIQRKDKEKIEVSQVKMTRKITHQELEDMLTTAFEGGSNYWCSNIRVTKKNKAIPEQQFLAEDIASGHVLEIEVTDAESEDHDYGIPEEKAGKHIVTRDQLIAAFQLMADKQPLHFQDFADDNSDATTGDVWFQLAVFGDVIYG